MRLKVFYLDDEVMLLQMFEGLFDQPEFEVRTFSDQEQALAALKTDPPDLLLLDYRMPGMNGDELAMTLDPELAKALITGDMSVVPKAKFERIFAKPYNSDLMMEFLMERLAKKVA